MQSQTFAETGLSQARRILAARGVIWLMPVVGHAIPPFVSHDVAIDAFLAGAPHAVVGASQDRRKFGNRCLRAYVQAGRRVFAVNPRAGSEVEGQPAYPDLAHLPERVHGITVVTPPEVTETVIDDAIAAGIEHVWLQPGAESLAAVRRAEAAGLQVIWGGPCILVELGRRG